MELLLLTKELTQQYCRKILMPEGATEILMDIADKINHDPQLFEIYWEFYKSYIDSGYWTTIWEPLTIHPYVKEVIGKEASLFYLHAALQRLPLTEQKYSEKGLSQELFVETLKDIGVWVQHAFHLVGYYAIGNFSWIWRHLEAKMFRLGGMQFMATPFSGIVKGFYNIKEDAILLLCGEGMELRANGDMQGVCNQEKTTDGYVTEYQETEDYFLGHPITPIGKGIRQQVKLKKTEWKKVLDKDDILLEIHIPRDTAFDMESLKDTYRQAKEFYATYFPEIESKGMVSHSWLFTPQLRELLPPSSNIVRFQKQFYLYPTAGSERFLWNFVFNEMTEVKEAKPDTLLRKQVLSYLEEGKEIFDMNGIFLDICGDFGTVVYE
ncbi:acyltransferase domain-containing protein [Paenibacillus sp. FSL K6-1566]|uniref:acyltransferase domain-containing protein n=1 Tax=unclassified Paenibacillus TaxID=185978 RepID=UPI003100C91D